MYDNFSYIMSLLSSFLILVALLFSVASIAVESEKMDIQNKMTITDKTEAMTLAIDFLNKQPWKDKYIFDDLKVVREGKNWTVTFKRVDGEKVRPSVGIVTIDAQTGKADWVKLR